MNKYTDTDEQAFVRISKVLKNWREATEKLNLMEVVAEAKERRIWKLKYDSWKDFCELECGITKQWANRLVLAKPTMDKIKQITDVSPCKSGKPAETSFHPVSINKAIKLKGTPSDKLMVAIGKPAVVDAKAKEKDSEGFDVPTKALPYWKRKDEIQVLLNAVIKIKSTCLKAYETKDALWSEVNFTSLMADLSNTYSDIKRAMPHAVCPACQGKLPDTCRVCSGRGLVSKLFYDQYTDVKLKEMRKKVAK